jgi:hypothetical protein
MKVRALRGVCIGVERHLRAGDTDDLEPAMVTYLTSIGAIERLPEEPAAAAPITTKTPEKSGTKEK